MEEGSIAVLVDAKEEYTKRLISIFKPHIYQGIKSIYTNANDTCEKDNEPENVLMIFQDFLNRIPKWSQEIINKEYDRIIKESGCDWIEDLLKVIYLTHIKILTIVHSSEPNKKLSLKVPTGQHFMHLCYIEIAREFWKNPYLLSDKVPNYNYQRNMRECETIISECISETIRKQLPVKHILKEYLGDYEESDNEEEDIKKPISSKYLKRLETIVKKELRKSNGNSKENIKLEENIKNIIRDELSKIVQIDDIDDDDDENEDEDIQKNDPVSHVNEEESKELDMELDELKSVELPSDSDDKLIEKLDNIENYSEEEGKEKQEKQELSEKPKSENNEDKSEQPNINIPISTVQVESITDELDNLENDLETRLNSDEPNAPLEDNDMPELEPVAEPVTEPVTESVAEPIVEPVVEPVVESDDVNEINLNEINTSNSTDDNQSNENQSNENQSNENQSNEDYADTTNFNELKNEENEANESNDNIKIEDINEINLELDELNDLNDVDDLQDVDLSSISNEKLQDEEKNSFKFF